MIFKVNNFSGNKDGLCNQCTTIRFFKAAESSSSKKTPTVKEGRETVSYRLSNLPKVKANPGFDQKMAAAFVMELERETLRRNRSWLKKHPKILLPDVISDFGKNAL